MQIIYSYALFNIICSVLCFHIVNIALIQPSGCYCLYSINYLAIRTPFQFLKLEISLSQSGFWSYQNDL